MITQAEAERQVVRLNALRFPPPVTDEVVAAYQEYARNYRHAVRMTDWLLRRYTDFPVPVEIAEAAEATISSEDVVKPDRKCRHCDGTGYEQVWQLVTYNDMPGGGCYKSLDTILSRETADELRKLCDGKKQILYDCVRACTHCRYGAAISAGPPKKEPTKAKGLQKADLRKFASGDVED